MTTATEVPAGYDEKLFGIEWLNTEDLIVDESYQRPQIEAEIKLMVENWDWKAVRTLAVSLRIDQNSNNYYAVIDGQQRLTAARRLGIEKIPCQVYMDLTHEEEARLFAVINTAKKPKPNDMFRAALAAGNEEAKLINMAVRNTGWGLDLDNSSSDRHDRYCSTAIASTATLMSIFRHGGILHLQQVLNITHGWYGLHMAGSVDILNGISRFLQMFGKEIELTKFTTKLSNESPDSILGLAGQVKRGSITNSGTNTRANAVTNVLVQIYNKGTPMKNRIGNFTI